jgi:signal transduction histidine kinase
MNNKEFEREVIGQTSFSVSARVAMQLGRESISNSIVAILELVKNAYDADAEDVKIRFSNLGSEDAILTIEDNGNGMTKEQLENNWMLIGTDNKLVSSKSRRKKRILTGEKGLGRLGLDRLAEITILQTFTSENKDGIELEIHWDKYENTTKRLEEISHNIYRIPKQIIDPVTQKVETQNKGTKLILKGLKDSWSKDDLERLQRQLSLLVSPFSSTNDFSIWFYSGLNLATIDGEIRSSEFLEAAEWHLASTLSANGEIVHEMISNARVVFEFKQPWGNVFARTASSLPSCGTIKFDLYFYSREAAKEASIEKRMINDFLDTNQGIRIYRDGFRVMPYGEPTGEGDWLNLALRRVGSPQGVRQGGWKVGYNQIVGAVFITREKNSALLDQTNREGLVEEQAYYDLRSFMMHAIRFFEEKRIFYERSQFKKKRFDEAREEAKKSAKDAQDATAKLRTEVNKVLTPFEKKGVDTSSIRDTLDSSLNQLEVIVKQAADAQEELGLASEEQQREFETQKDTLGNLASLGILAATFGHESLGYANLVVNNVRLLKQNIKPLLAATIPNTFKDLTDNIHDIEHAAKRIETFAEFTLKNVRRDKRTRKQVYLDRIIQDIFSSFGEELKAKRGVQININMKGKIPPIFAFLIDWESIIINFITNSVWALENTPRDKRKIRVNLQEVNNKIRLSFADSGRGIEAGVIDRIFEPNFSRKTNERGDIIGTGMGLAIVENFVYSYGGTTKVDAHSDIGGAEFIIEVPIQETRGKKGNKK